jgi:23S rRNA (cytidine1920-2'-O)/16S rRNA (cytidine1409-2'-O)-methyltransferase
VHRRSQCALHDCCGFDSRTCRRYAGTGYFDDESEADDDSEDAAEIEANFDFLTGDLSFISLTLVLPAVVRLLKPGGDLLMLVKPQFELQPGQIGKGGIVRDAAHFEFVEKRLRDACAALGLEVKAWLESPIEGGDGNREFFIQAVKGHDVAGEDQPLPAAPQRKVAKRVPRSETARRPRTARRL